MSVRHETVRVERTYAARVARVFSAWTSAEALARWYVPGDAGWRSSITEHEFRVGGRKCLLFGPVGQPPYQEDCRYEDIVPEQRIIFSMTIANGELRQTASLVTIEFLPQGASTFVRVTDQLAILDGADTAAGREHGWGEVLDKLTAEVR